MTNAEFTDQTRDELKRLIAESDVAECDLTNSDIDQLVGLFETWFQRNMTIIPDELWRAMVRHLVQFCPHTACDLISQICALDPTITREQVTTWKIT